MTIERANASMSRPLMVALPVLVAAWSLSGCMASPTYGTGKSSNEQLLEDVTGVLSIVPKDRGPAIEYKPRPELVKPPAKGALPAPQQNVAEANPAWPESPEQRRARLRQIATERQNDPTFVPMVDNDVSVDTGQQKRDFRGNPIDLGTSNNQRAEFNRRLAMSQQGSPTSRRFLSEPPVAYRQPAATAPSGDVGEEEWRKEARQKKAAGGGSGRGWRDWIPGL